MDDNRSAPVRARWARLRFSIIGSLLASPPEQGQLQERIAELAARHWEHPTTGEAIQFSFSTLERWLYLARREQDDPFGILARKTRKDAGSHPSILEALREVIAEQYKDHPTWSYQLHHKNLVALAKRRSELGNVPSPATLRRYMKEHGMRKCKKKRNPASQRSSVAREKRSYEVSHVNQLWHLDFHECSRALATVDGTWVKPWLFGVLDDHSRLACHLQWYWIENTENLVHGLSQALQKRGVPRMLLSDGGGAMKAAETRSGLMRLGTVHEMTLPETPEQNGKQENFWTRVEQQLLPMLEGVADLTLKMLNDATQAWVEHDYHRHIHSETGQSPIERFLNGNNIGRPCPDSARLRDVFRTQQWRTQRRSDCTISVEGRRYELPSRYRSVQRVLVRYARWDGSSVDLIDPRTENILCAIFPLDRHRNADEYRRLLEPNADPQAVMVESSPRRSGIAPYLADLLAQYAANGLPPAYVPKDEITTKDSESCAHS